MVRSRGFLNIPSVIFIHDGASLGEKCGNLKKRIVHSWPFRSVLFVADLGDAQWLRRQGLPVIHRGAATELSLDDILQHPSAVLSQASANQKIGIVTQALWPWAGSSTAFLNQVDCLLNDGMFTIRIFNSEDRYGGSSQKLLRSFLPNNRWHSGPHLESLACPPGRPTAAADDEYEAFRQKLQVRSEGIIADEPVRRLAQMAEVIICNAVTETIFSARIAPKATMVLDTHDYLTRYIYNRPRMQGEQPPFACCSNLRKQAKLERELWSIPDVCSTVSEQENQKISRYANGALQVLPRPYVSFWKNPGRDSQWDIVVVADSNLYAINSLRWFLTEVVEPEPRLKELRIGIGGNVKTTLEQEWKDRLPNVKWLGFVPDIDNLYHSARMSVNADLSGTGISVKALTSFAYRQPMVASPDALRGMPTEIRESFPTQKSGKEMAAEILRLLDNPREYRKRAELMAALGERLENKDSYTTAMRLGTKNRQTATRARDAFLSEFAGWEAAIAQCRQQGLRMVSSKLNLSKRGNATAFLGLGWHKGERWGRWTDGGHSTIHLPAQWFRHSSYAVFHFTYSDMECGVAIRIGGRLLTPPGNFVNKPRIAVQIDYSMRDIATDTITLEIFVDRTFVPVKAQGGDDHRLLGVGVSSVTLVRKRWARLFRLFNAEIKEAYVHVPRGNVEPDSYENHSGNAPSPSRQAKISMTKELALSFYDRSEDERTTITLSTINEGRTLFERWTALTTSEAASWNLRAVAAAKWLDDEAGVADLGCGTMHLERYLRPDQIYIPVDVVARDSRTIVCDFNREALPPTPFAAACLGLIEYLHKPQEFLSILSAQYKVAVVSYCVTDAPGAFQNRRAHGWVNDFNTAGCEAVFRESGWAILDRRWIDDLQLIWRLGSQHADRQ